MHIVTQRFIRCHDKLREDNRIRSSRQFALALDYLPQSLSEILKGRRDVTVDLVRKAVEVFRISPSYLITGEGPMFMSEEEHPSLKVLTVIKNIEGEERIVHVPAPAQSVYAQETGNPSFMQHLPTFTLPDYQYKSGTFRSFEVTGDNMQPTLLDGDRVICSFLDATLWEQGIKDNYVYVVITRGDVLVRRVLNFLGERKQLRLMSDNLFYEPTHIGLHEIREVWYVRSRFCASLKAPVAQIGGSSQGFGELFRMIQEQNELILHLQKKIDQISG